MKALGIILAIACAGLAGTLTFHRTQVQARLTVAQAELTTATNRLVETMAKLADQEKLAGFLQGNLDTRTTELAAVSNDLARVNTQFASTQTELKGAQTDLKGAQSEIKTVQADAQLKGARITQLEAEKDEMTKKLGELAGRINSLDGRITETKRKLAASEGDREFLMKELGRLQAEKRELERQFNDLALLRDQIRKLKDELSIARRLEWIRRGLYGAEQKGAEKLQPGFATPAGKTNFDLNVEIRQDGSATVVTNPPANPPPPK